MRKIILFGILITFLVVFSLACGRTEINFSHTNAPDSSWDKGAVRFAEIVNKQSNGKIQVNIHPAGELVRQNRASEIEQLKTGKISMAWLSSSYLSRAVDSRFAVFNLPWMFPNHEVATAVLDGGAGDMAKNLVKDKDLVILGIGINGFHQLTNNKRKVINARDLRSLKILAPPGKLYPSIFNLIGATGIPANFANIGEALDAGAADGQEGSLETIYNNKLYERQKYLTIWNYSYDPIFLCMGKATYDKLSEKQRETIASAARGACAYQRNLIMESDRTLIDALRDKGMQVTKMTPGAIKELQALVKPIYRQMEPFIDKSMVISLQRQVGIARPVVK
jgi:tripartite ATP-independent transporter DctP family solute receptor